MKSEPASRIHPHIYRALFFSVAVVVAVLAVSVWISDLQAIITQQGNRASAQILTLGDHVASLSAEIDSLKSQDQRKRNDALEKDIKSIETSYKQTVDVYELLIELKSQTKSPTKSVLALESGFAGVLTLLSKRNYATASAQLAKLKASIQTEQDKLVATSVVGVSAPTSNAPPGSGYSRQNVTADIGTYLVDIVSADMGSTRVIVDTASEHDCGNDCPVLSVGEYVARNGAFAGVNGAYFCPSTYPQCAGKTNSFDTLLMNKNKVYFNSDNNVYSRVPAVIFLGGSMRFVGASQEWGRDTSPDGVIANQGLLLSGGNIVYGDDGDPKKGSRGTRAFVGSRGPTAYIGVVHNVTVAEMAHVLKALGLEGALNLDSGGSIALWANGGYKAGPGRNIPNAILFVRR